MAGKGDTPRPCNKKRYDENFDNIKWKEDYINMNAFKESEKDD